MKENFSRNIRRFLSVCFCLPILSAAGISLPDTASDKDYLLVLNTYTSDAPWSNAIISPVQRMIAADSSTNIFIEHMQMLMVDDTIKFNELKRSIFSKYGGHAPKTVLLLGSSALLLCDDMRELWGDIPLVLCENEDFVGPPDAYISKKMILPSDRIPISDLADKYNLTLLQTKVFLTENIELMRHTIPGMKKLILVGDARHINQQLDYDIRQILKEQYPGMQYAFLSAEEITTNQLLANLEAVDKKATGVLFSSWFIQQEIAGNIQLMANTYRIIANTSTPVFSLKNAVMDHSGIIGGYMYPPKPFEEELLKTLSAVLGGVAPRTIPFYVPEGMPIFDYAALQQKGFSPNDCPPGTVFLNVPPTFWKQYGYILLPALLIIIALFVFIYQYTHIRALRTIKESQQKQLETSRELSTLFDNMPITYTQLRLIRDQTGQIADVEICMTNRHYQKVFMPSKEQIGKRGSEIFGSDFTSFIRLAHILDTEKRPITFSYYLRKAEIHQDVVITLNAKKDYIDVFGVDNTDLYHTQQKLDNTNHKLAMALEVANLVPWKWDIPAHTILCDINRPIELSNDAQSQDEEQLAVPEEQYFSKICREDRDRVKEAYRKLIEGETDKVREEYRIITRDKNRFRMEWVEARAAVDSRDETGKPKSLVGSSLVITERKAMEQELLDARDRAEESNRLKSAFLANMSHEIRTPLNAIVGFSGLLPTIENPEEQREYVNIIENNNALLLQLIGDILDLSKIESGMLEFTYVPQDLNGLLQEIERSSQLRTGNKPLKIRLGKHLPECRIETDRNRLTQVMSNLINNAIKFTEKGEITFGYTLDEKSKTLRFYVTDTGCGIPESKHQEIFNRFVKLNSFVQGTGLGLPICQMIVQKMGGQMGVESGKSEGSTFWFTLPYKPVVQKEEVQKPGHEPIPAHKDEITILIAEDNESNFTLFETILRKDYRILHAWNGREAVEIFREHRPHIVLMDINMPVMNGYEATREIRKLSADVPILAITAYAYASDEQKILDEGFDGYAAKPINAGILRKKIVEMIEQRLMLF